MPTDVMDAIKEGFAALPVEDSIRQAALVNLARWRGEDQFLPYRDQLEDLILREQWETLLDCFYQIIPFGTGGRRGPVGIGPNRINPWTISASVQGHVAYLREVLGRDAPLAVVIAYDVRIFKDLRGIYNPNLPNPLLGLTSMDLAHIAAGVYAANGVTAWLLPDEPPGFMSTPELSFTIRRLGAAGGINLSASHNHPDDNGGKFYDQRGGQEIPPNDENMARQVEMVDQIHSWSYPEAIAAGKVRFIPPEIREEYYRSNLERSLSLGRDMKVVYTNLHGTGDTTVLPILTRAGFPVITVKEQLSHDGTFPGVPYAIPNPELPESMDLACAVADQEGARLVISTDPDADRLGAKVKDVDGNWVFLTGNQIFVLVAAYMLDEMHRKGRLPASPIVVKTEVTTDMVSRVAASCNAEVVGDLLVGFKYVAELLHQLETRGQYGNVSGKLDDFIIGGEESHGILINPAIRDKDAAGPALMLAELATSLQLKGRSLLDYLDEIYLRDGYVHNDLVPTVLSGVVGKERILAIQQGLRKSPPERIAGLKVLKFVDHWDPSGLYGPIKSETDRASRNVLVMHLEQNVRIIHRPSGTEPKAKTYIEVAMTPFPPGAGAAELRRAREDAARITAAVGHDFIHYCMAILGIDLPDWTLKLSGLVDRLDILERFVPEFEQRADQVVAGTMTRENLAGWLEDRLRRYGKNPRGLIREGFTEYLDGRLAQYRGGNGDAPEPDKQYHRLMLQRELIQA